jgi:predicted transcriptional regulator
VSSTSVHIPQDLLRQLDRVAKQRRVSRNRLIVEACRSLLGDGTSEWPDDFFASGRLSPRDRAFLDSTFDAWVAEIARSRKSKKTSPF